MDAPARAVGLTFGNNGTHDTGRAALAADVSAMPALRLVVRDRAADVDDVADATAVLDTRTPSARNTTR